MPLKVLMKDSESLSPFTGYYNKKKNLFYYKSRQKGTKVNVSAKILNSKFIEIISSIGYDKKNVQSLKCILENKLRTQFANDAIDEKPNKKRISEIKSQMETIEEQLVLNKITKEQFDKYYNKYSDEIRGLETELEQSKKMSSNLEKAIEKSLKIVQNLHQAWVTADYYDKQRL